MKKLIKRNVTFQKVKIVSPDDQIAEDKIHTALSISEGKPTASNDVNGGGTLSP